MISFFLLIFLLAYLFFSAVTVTAKVNEQSYQSSRRHRSYPLAAREGATDSEALRGARVLRGTGLAPRAHVARACHQRFTIRGVAAPA